MAKNFKSALGSVGPALHEILSAIVQTNDLAAAGQIRTFKELVSLALKAKEAGIDMDSFLRLISTFRIERAGYQSGEIHMAGSASTGLETKDGHALHVDFKAGGSLAGFDLGLNAGYQQETVKATFERSEQNFRILARFAVTPDDLSEELKTKVMDFIAKSPPDTQIPALPEEFETPTLEILREMLPDLAKIFGKETDE